jgi:hypothetical protein
MSADAELLLLFGGLHLFGLILAGIMFVLFLRSDPTDSQFRPDEGDDGGGGGSDRERPRTPEGPGDGGLPLPDAVQARIRLREARRLADLHPKPPRRPEHEPRPARPRRPVKS